MKVVKIPTPIFSFLRMELLKKNEKNPMKANEPTNILGNPVTMLSRSKAPNKNRETKSNGLCNQSNVNFVLLAPN